MEKVPLKESIYEEIIKKSRFVVKTFPLNPLEDFNDILTASQDLSANHNCWAWIFDNQYRFSDDGEPSGTAGKPIYQALNMQNWNRTAIIITRYFGGIKLGAGGLIRAYNGTASRALEETPFSEPCIVQSIRIRAQHNYTGIIYSLLKRYDLSNEKIEYDGKMINFYIEIAIDKGPLFIKDCIDESSGSIEVAVFEKQSN
jgi:uncharacterized YigZ family protein